MASYSPPQELKEWIDWLSAGLHGRNRWRLPVLMSGLLFASGRRVVASWIRVAGVSDDYREFYFFLQSIGKRWSKLGQRLLSLVIRQVLTEPRVLLAIDDSPTKRYGPKVEGAGLHHDPTPGPTGPALCYGHIWVTLAVIVRHPFWGVIGLPIFSWLYVRRKDIPKISPKHRWTFQTKLQQAVDLVRKGVPALKLAGKQVWVVADGAYTKRPFVQPVMEQEVTLVGRIRKDAALFDVPIPEKTKGRGRPRKYGPNRISLAKRAAHRHGWQEVTCQIYGKETTKQVKTFLATHRTFGGAIRIVIVKEKQSPQFFYCTQLDASVREIIEAFADRAGIEQVFHDVKEIWGSGQQQVRNIWSNVAVWHLNMWMYTLTELWAWKRSAKELVRRKDSPWDDQERRPSHADRRKTLQATCLANEFSRPNSPKSLQRKIQIFLNRVLRISV